MSEEPRNLNDIVEVRELVGVRSLNWYLKRGWVLMDQFTRMDIGPGDFCSVYVIGRPRSVDPGDPDY